jgi:hypothetical protein
MIVSNGMDAPKIPHVRRYGLWPLDHSEVENFDPVGTECIRATASRLAFLTGRFRRYRDSKKASALLNNRAENSHQPTCERERRKPGFRVPERTRAFL